MENIIVEINKKYESFLYMTIEELEKEKNTIKLVLEDIEKLIEGKKEKHEFVFEFNHTNDRRKGIPYVAKLIHKNGKIEREFYDLSTQNGGKKCTVYGEYKACEGDIIEERVGGSWNNDYRYWFYIDEVGNQIKVADISNSDEKAKVEKYLRRQISKEELLVV